jgi:hypothetical protein
MVRRQVAAGRTKGEGDFLELEQIDARIETRDVAQIDADGAEQSRTKLSQLLGIGGPKNRKTMQGVGGDFDHSGFLEN